MVINPRKKQGIGLALQCNELFRKLGTAKNYKSTFFLSVVLLFSLRPLLSSD
jgi:hypothetical protein